MDGLIIYSAALGDATEYYSKNENVSIYDANKRKDQDKELINTFSSILEELLDKNV